ncbi:hypothetical protein [Pseudomonas sp. I2]|uniref:hypothetical protein n=1 Tax=Pseudomonas sp. I2 TaxID=1338438 RepID=UPI0034D7B223
MNTTLGKSKTSGFLKTQAVGGAENLQRIQELIKKDKGAWQLDKLQDYDPDFLEKVQTIAASTRSEKSQHVHAQFFRHKGEPQQANHPSQRHTDKSLELAMIRNRLQRSLRSLDGWATDKHLYQPIRLDNYIAGTSDLGLACDDLFRLGLIEIKKGLLQAPKGMTSLAQKNIIAGTIRMIVSDATLIELLKNTKQPDTDSLDGITHLMLCAVATGQHQFIEPFHSTVFKGLNNGYGVRDGHNLPLGTTLRYAAFGLAIIGDWLGKPLDLDKHALPRDPAWGQLVAHWREPDPEKLLPVLLAACDTHVERIALTSRELDSGNFEFGSPFEAVYPAEILAILNLRRSLGLANPFIDHPLMKTPYAALTCPPGTRFEKDELLERFLLAARKHDPEAVPEGLYEAVQHLPTEH